MAKRKARKFVWQNFGLSFLSSNVTMLEVSLASNICLPLLYAIAILSLRVFLIGFCDQSVHFPRERRQH